MNRQELLTQLAMELAEWPYGRRAQYGRLPPSWHWHCSGTGASTAKRDMNTEITKPDWLAERERLINKPGREGKICVRDAQGYIGIFHWNEFEPLVSEVQRLTDEAMELIGAELDDFGNVHGVVRRMIAAGYRKKGEA